MKRFPGYDCGTSRAELAAFSSLGLVALALIAVALSDALKFAASRDSINMELSGTGSTQQTVAGVITNNALTNLSRLQTAKPVERRLFIRGGAVGTSGQPL
jgi:hypothetical protein